MSIYYSSFCDKRGDDYSTPNPKHTSENTRVVETNHFRELYRYPTQQSNPGGIVGILPVDDGVVRHPLVFVVSEIIEVQKDRKDAVRSVAPIVPPTPSSVEIPFARSWVLVRRRKCRTERQPNDGSCSFCSCVG